VTDTSKPEVTIAIMAWNEVRSLRDVAEELDAEMARHRVSYEIVVIDDGSSDGTGDLADQLALGNPRLRVIHHPRNLGLGGVYRTGFSQARGQWLTFFPADGQFPATILGDYLAERENVDLILGYLPRRDGPITPKLLSLAERALLRGLFGHFPRFQGILLFRRSLLAQHTLVSQGRGWIVLMEFILRATRAGARTLNLPINLRPRRSGTSKVNNLRSIWSNLRQVLELRLFL
jgi:glycosyltransferase involved in cell wall biosynthesis